jgi:hypothetical protein
MKLHSRTAALTVLFCASSAFAQQDKTARPSPPAKATCTMTDGATISIDYSSPRAKGRKIFGGIVPYGEVWRLGANEATSFVNTSDVTIGRTKVPAGSYTLFAIPNANEWTLVISKKTGEWGIPYPGADSDLARAAMNVTKMSSAVDNFSISFDKNGHGCSLRVDWEYTRASVDITK